MTRFVLVLFFSFGQNVGLLTLTDLSSRHLNSEHSHDDRSIAQWKIQQDIVQCLESQVGGY